MTQTRLSRPRRWMRRPATRMASVLAILATTAAASVASARSASPLMRLTPLLLAAPDSQSAVDSTTPADTVDSLELQYPPRPGEKEGGAEEDDGNVGPSGYGSGGGSGTPVDPGSMSGGSFGRNDLVKACRSMNTMLGYAQKMQQAVELVGGLKDLAGALGGLGVPVADFAMNSALKAYAHSAKIGSKAEQYAAAYGVGSLCNTSETTRLAQSQFDFVRLVVNKGIEQPLPDVKEVIAASDSLAAPIGYAARDARFERLFARPASGRVDQSYADAVSDTVLRAAYETAAHGDSAAEAATQVLRQLAEAQLARPTAGPDGRPACLGISEQGDTTYAAPDTAGTCGPLSPGRARQLTAAASNLNATQQVLINQMTARRIQLEVMRFTLEQRDRALHAASRPFQARW